MSSPVWTVVDAFRWPAADATLIFETKLVSIEGKETTEAEL